MAVVTTLAAVAAVTVTFGATAPGSLAEPSPAATAPGVSSEAAPSTTKDPDPRAAALTAQLQQQTQGKATVVVQPGATAASFIGSSPDHPLTGPSADPGASARAFVDQYGPLLGVEDPATSLVEARRVQGEAGQTSVRYAQHTNGLPVVASELAVQLDASGRVLATSGDLSTVTGVDTTATVSAADAAQHAVALTAKHKAVAPDTLTVSAPELEVYDPTIIDAGGPAAARTVWSTEVRTAIGDIDSLVLVDARSGAIALEVDQRQEAKNRSVCDDQNIPGLSATCTSPVRVEGGAATGITDVDNAYLYAGVTYDFYKNVLGRDSVDNAGLPLKSTVRYCPSSNSCPYANAFWNRQQMVYGDGFAGGDDVVGHELTHGVTQYTSSLFYFSESGAINESLSDVFGELIDQSSTAGGGNDTAGARWLMGEDLPGGAIRSMADPTLFSDPDKMTSTFYYGGTADNRGVHTNSGVNNKAAFLMTDGATFNGKVVTGIGATKVAHIYYQAETTLIGAGTNYADLYNILQQSCSSLVGQFGITAGDCTQVKNAVDAVEMNLRATAPGAAAASSPVCPGGNPTPANLFLDSMETSATNNWLASNGSSWQYTTVYPRSGKQSLATPDITVASDTAAWLANPIAVPATPAAFLQFNHAFGLDAAGSTNYDGGVVEVSANGGPWTDASSLMVQNGYNGTINGGGNNQLNGRAAFVNNSPGYETTRLNLASFAGKTINVRFRLGTDLSDGYLGWFIDDVRAYTCNPALPAGSRFHSVDPSRILDSRTANGGWSSPLVAGSPRELQVTGLGGPSNVPATASAVIMNVTATGSSNGSFLKVWPAGVGEPGVSNLNFGAGQTIPNLVTVKLGTGGKQGRLLFGNAIGSVDVIADVVGYFDDGVGAGDLFTGITPTRILDTRTLNQPITQTTRDLQVTGVANNVPATATAVVANVTATGGSDNSFLTAWPTGIPQPNVSNLNFGAGETIPNLVTVKLGAGGKVSFVNAVGSVHIVVDVVGYFDPSSGSKFHPITPTRMLDSRLGTGAIAGQWGPGNFQPATRRLDVAGADASGVRADATAVVTNVTVTGGTQGSFVTVYPDGVPAPNSSNLNFGPGQTIPNLVMVKVGPFGQIDLKNALGNVDIIADAVGFYSAT